MKRIVLILYYLLISFAVCGQSQYDYMDDSAVAGGAERVFNVYAIIFLVVIVIVVIGIILNIIAKIAYEFSPQKEIDRQKKEKEERDKQERIRKEQEHLRILLSLPENKVRLFVKGRPHLVELGVYKNSPEMVAICLWSVNKIIWNETDITEQVGYIKKRLNDIYGKHYKSRYDCYAFPDLKEIIISQYCADLAKQSCIVTFEIEFTIRGDFDTQKLQLIDYSHIGFRNEVSRNIKGLEFVVYDGDVIQSHLVNGKPLCFPLEGYNGLSRIQATWKNAETTSGGHP